MAVIGRIARGTANGASTDSSGNYTLADPIVVGTTGSTLVATFSYFDSGSGPVDRLLWNGNVFSRVNETGIVNRLFDIWILENAPAGSGPITVDDAASGAVLSWLLTVTEVTDSLLASPLDQIIAATGRSTAPNSGDVTTTQEHEMLLGFILRTNILIDGTWSAGFSAGQSVTRTGVSLEEGYKGVTTIGTYSAGKTGETNASYSAVILTFIELPPPPPPPPVTTTTYDYSWLRFARESIPVRKDPEVIQRIWSGDKRYREES